MNTELRSGNVLWVENTENKSEKERKIKTGKKPLVFTDKIVTSENFDEGVFVERSSKYITECKLRKSVYEKSYTMLQFMNYILMNLPERRLWKQYNIDRLARVTINRINKYTSYPEFSRCVSDNNVDINNWKDIFTEISNVE